MRPKSLVLAAILLAVAYPLGGWLRTRSRPAADSGASGEQQVLSRVSYQMRVLLADVLWNRIDTYLHEGVPIRLQSGGWGVSFAGNLDVLALLDWILVLDPHFVVAYGILSQYHENLGNIRRAIEVAEKGVQENGGSEELVDLLGQLGVLYIRDNQPLEKAIAQFERALALTTAGRGHSEVYREDVLRGSLIALHHKAGRIEDAQRIAAAGASTLDPAHPALVALAARGTAASPRPPDPAGKESANGEHAHGDRDDHDDHDDHRDHGAVKAAPKKTSLYPRDLHRRPWMEKERLAEIDRKIWLAGAFGILLSLRFVARRRISTLS